MAKFEYLKQYIGHNNLKGIYFLKVPYEEVIEGERILGVEFPNQLKEFYQEIGSGILSCGHKYPEMYCEVSNFLLPPIAAANFSKGILEFEDQDYYMAEDAYEDLQPGDLPFFEIADGSSFMTMKLNSDNPNAVWYMGYEKIEDSFEKFIWRLYYEDPNYFASNW